MENAICLIIQSIVYTKLAERCVCMLHLRILFFVAFFFVARIDLKNHIVLQRASLSTTQSVIWVISWDPDPVTVP